MIFFLVTCIILVIVVIVQAAIAALAYIFWSLFQAAANCDVRYGVCQCRGTSSGESIPIERKSGCVVRLEVYRESRRRNRRRRKLIQSQVSAAWLCFSKRSISVLYFHWLWTVAQQFAPTPMFSPNWKYLEEHTLGISMPRVSFLIHSVLSLLCLFHFHPLLYNLVMKGYQANCKWFALMKG